LPAGGSRRSAFASTADRDILSRILALKTDAGSGALEQMVLGEFCAAHFAEHVPKLTRALRDKLETLMQALDEQFGSAAEFIEPKGGIYLWVKLPEAVDTARLARLALAAGIAINPGPEWTAEATDGRHCLRICFAHPSAETIREGIAALARVCHDTFGVPARMANVAAP
jgi:2-aminoadipate transaminase